MVEGGGEQWQGKAREEVGLPNGALLFFKYVSQKVAKSVDNNNSQSFGDLQPSACLLRATAANSRSSEYWCTFDMSQKAAAVKADLFTCGSGTMVFC